MILEVAVLDVRPGQREAFEAAFAVAEPLIAGARGHLGHELRRCVEDQDRFLLLVQWGTLEDHTEGFRGSEDYERWRALLHHFYDPLPVVQHYAEVRDQEGT